MSEKIKKKWRVSTEVLSVNGVQVWEVEAETKEQALELVKDGEGDCVAEQIEVMHISDPYNAVEIENE